MQEPLTEGEAAQMYNDKDLDILQRNKMRGQLTEQHRPPLCPSTPQPPMIAVATT